MARVLSLVLFSLLSVTCIVFAAPQNRETARTVHKRELVINPELQKYLSQLPPGAQEMIKKHPSQAMELLEAFREDLKGGNAALSKRDVEEQDPKKKLQEMLVHIKALQKIVAETVEADQRPLTASELTGKLLADIKQAKAQGVKLQDVLRTLSKQVDPNSRMMQGT
jgi:hypothetical protein